MRSLLPILFALLACAHAPAPAVTVAPLPGRSIAALQLGDRAYAAGDLDGAVRAYGRAVAEEPSSAEARFLRARALLELDQVGAADRDVAAALQLSPAHWEARCLQGLVRERQGLRAEAAQAFRSAAALAPRAEAPRNDLAFLSLLDGRPQEAYDALRALAREFPRSPRIWNNLALAALRLGRRGESATARTTATRLLRVRR